MGKAADGADGAEVWDRGKQQCATSSPRALSDLVPPGGDRCEAFYRNHICVIGVLFKPVQHDLNLGRSEPLDVCPALNSRTSPSGGQDSGVCDVPRSGRLKNHAATLILALKARSEHR